MTSSENAQLLKTIPSNVPDTAVASYARWWQVETYIREIVYTEMRTKYGSAWTEYLPAGVPDRAERDLLNYYMASADAEDVLAYADARVLFDLIEDHWGLFEQILPPQKRWLGMSHTMLAVRHRIAHCRKPHRDDLSRLEQMLRDLETGAKIFYRAYASNRDDFNPKDPVAKAWAGKHHEAAHRLIDHCERKYETRFHLTYSLRPWAEPDAQKMISGRPGTIWQATWVLGAREIGMSQFWNAIPKASRDLCLHLLLDSFSVTATFAGIESPGAVADAIAQVFEATILNSRAMRTEEKSDDWLERVRADAEELPPKVSYSRALNLFDPFNPDAFSIFSA